jgi:hypothetical protein
MKIHKLIDHGYTIPLEDLLRLIKGIDSKYKDEVDHIIYAANKQDWSSIYNVSDLHAAFLLLIEYIKGLELYTLSDA